MANFYLRKKRNISTKEQENLYYSSFSSHGGIMKRGSFFLREAQSESPKRIRKDVEHLFYDWDGKKNVIPLRWMQTQGFIVLYPTSFVPLAGVEVHVPYELDRGSDALERNQFQLRISVGIMSTTFRALYTTLAFKSYLVAQHC